MENKSSLKPIIIEEIVIFMIKRVNNGLKAMILSFAGFGLQEHAFDCKTRPCYGTLQTSLKWTSLATVWKYR